jgi:hypothetical protein
VNSLGERSTLHSRLCIFSRTGSEVRVKPRGREQSRRVVNITFRTLLANSGSEVKVSSKVVKSLGERSTLYFRLCIFSQTGSEVKVSREVVNNLGERSTLYSGLWGLSQFSGKVSLEVVNSLEEWSTLYSRLCIFSQFRLRGQSQPRGREQSRRVVNIIFQTLYLQPIQTQRSKSASRSRTV